MERDPKPPSPAPQPATPAPPPFDPDLDLIGDMHRGEQQSIRGEPEAPRN